MFVTDLEPPYYAVIFASERTDRDDGYGEMAERMLELAAQQPGFLGVDSARDPRLGITVSYWRDLESIRAWRAQADHIEAQRLGRERWYRRYTLRVAKVERSLRFEAVEATHAPAPPSRSLVRLATADDAGRLAEVFYDSVHGIARRDYSQRQLDAWAPQVPDAARWADRLRTRTTFVAELDGSVAGFGELEANGHIDCFYCHPDFQRRGVGSAILGAIERAARERGIRRLFAEVSLTARPFFEARGFTVVRRQSVERNGIELTNFAIEKTIDGMTPAG